MQNIPNALSLVNQKSDVPPPNSPISLIFPPSASWQSAASNRVSQSITRIEFWDDPWLLLGHHIIIHWNAPQMHSPNNIYWSSIGSHYLPFKQIALLSPILPRSLSLSLSSPVSLIYWRPFIPNCNPIQRDLLRHTNLPSLLSRLS